MAGGAMRELFADGEKVLCYHGDLLYEVRGVTTRPFFNIDSDQPWTTPTTKKILITSDVKNLF